MTDVRDLPTAAFGPRSPMWWGTLAFVALEGMGFALAIGAFLYLAVMDPSWGLAAPAPDPLPGTLLLLVLLASLVPNRMVGRWAEAEDLRRVRLGLLAMALLGLVPLGLRVWEFAALGVRWDANAYGSMLWLLLGLHTAHLATDVAETLVLLALVWTRHGAKPRRFSDVADNAFYWDFVVASWLVLYLVVYGVG